jgi:hypothetical protein
MEGYGIVAMTMLTAAELEAAMLDRVRGIPGHRLGSAPWRSPLSCRK